MVGGEGLSLPGPEGPCGCRREGGFGLSQSPGSHTQDDNAMRQGESTVDTRAHGISQLHDPPPPSNYRAGGVCADELMMCQRSYNCLLQKFRQNDA